jgi:hypothetical protein
MKPLAGRWVFVALHVEYLVVDGVCRAVSGPGGLWSPEATRGARLLSIVGPPRPPHAPIRPGDRLLFAHPGSSFTTPPIEKICRLPRRPRRPKLSPKPKP